jgi:hypothetical protein
MITNKLTKARFVTEFGLIGQSPEFGNGDKQGKVHHDYIAKYRYRFELAY